MCTHQISDPVHVLFCAQHRQEKKELSVLQSHLYLLFAVSTVSALVKQPKYRHAPATFDFDLVFVSRSDGGNFK